MGKQRGEPPLARLPSAPPRPAAPGSARAAIPDVLGAGLHAALHPRETARRGVALAELLVR
ncbi:MAG: TetR/AcrR family transcriptional regulator, partial [Gemmatimonadota bacterium]